MCVNIHLYLISTKNYIDNGKGIQCHALYVSGEGGSWWLQLTTKITAHDPNICTGISFWSRFVIAKPFKN